MKRWPLNTAYVWEYAPFVRALAPLMCGIAAYDATTRLQIPAIIPTIVTAICFVAFVAVAARNKRSQNTALAALIAILLLAGGYGIAHHHDVQNDKYWFGKSINTSNIYLAKLCADPIEKEHTWKLTVETIKALKENGEQQVATGAAFVYVYKDVVPMRLHKGDTVLLPGNWQTITNAGNPHEFDYAAYCHRNNIWHRQTCRPSALRLYSAVDPTALPITDKAHNWCMAQLNKYLTDPKTKGLLQAMLLGDEVNLDEDLRQSYAETGIVHIIAISGGNVGMFFIAIGWLFFWLRGPRYQWIKYAIALPLVLFYVAMAGAPPSAVRAAIMFTILAIGVVFHQPRNSLNQLLAASTLLLVYNPAWLFSLGFQLSFVAVLSLVFFYSPLSGWLAPTTWITKKLWGAVAGSLAAEALTAPVVIYYFHIFPLFFVVANVIAFLFMGLVLIMGIAIIALSWAPVAAEGISFLATWLTRIFNYLVAILQSVNPRSFSFLMLSGFQLLLLLAVICGLGYYLLRGKKQALFTAGAGAALLLLSLCTAKYQSLRQNKLIVYNTGKTPTIERIIGNRYQTLTEATAKTQYTTTAAHIGMRAWHPAETPSDNLFTIGGKTILVLQEPITGSQPFPVDVVVITTTAGIDARQIMKAYSPKEVVLAQAKNFDSTGNLLSGFVAAGIKIHSVTANGAWIAE